MPLPFLGEVMLNPTAYGRREAGRCGLAAEHQVLHRSLPFAETSARPLGAGLGERSSLATNLHCRPKRNPVIDGPEGFALTVTHMGGSPCRVGGVSGAGEAIGRQRLFKAGSFTARQRVGIWTNGPASHIHVTEA